MAELLIHKENKNSHWFHHGGMIFVMQIILANFFSIHSDTKKHNTYLLIITVIKWNGLWPVVLLCLIQTKRQC